MGYKLQLVTILLMNLGLGNCDWNFLVFTQQWPPTVCKEWEHRDPKNQCIKWKGKDTWAVHGLWPSNIDGDDPAFCNKSMTFNMTAIKPIQGKLEIFWPNMYKGTPDESFWSHEWEKHGTCAVTDSRLSTEFAYFSSGLNLVQKFNFYEYLLENNIQPQPHTHIMVSDVKLAIKNKLGVDPALKCYKDKESKEHLIQEIRVCLDKELRVIECPTEMANTEDCPEKDYLLYLPVDSVEPRGEL